MVATRCTPSSHRVYQHANEVHGEMIAMVNLVVKQALECEKVSAAATWIVENCISQYRVINCKYNIGVPFNDRFSFDVYFIEVLTT